MFGRTLSGIWIIPAVFISAYLLFFVLFWLAAIIISLTFDVRKSYTTPSPFISAVFNVCYNYICGLAGVRLHISGFEKLPDKDTRFLFVSNHRSKFDNMIQSAALFGRPIAFVSKPENFGIPVGHRYMTRCCYLSIDRENPINALKTIKKAGELIGAGSTSIGIYPEGHRGTGELQEFRSGCFLAAQKAKCPIVVAFTDGTEKIHINFPWRMTNVNLDIIAVLPYESFASKRTGEISDEIRNLMLAHSNERNGKNHDAHTV